MLLAGSTKYLRFRRIMNMNKFFRILLVALLASVSVVSCDPPLEDPVENTGNNGGGGDSPSRPSQPTSSVPEEIQQADQFAINTLGVYYLWNKEINSDLDKLAPTKCMDPVEVVKQIRYHENGKEVDHWTVLTKDLESMTSSVEGLGLSFGYDLTGMWVDETQTSLVFIVNYVAKDKPAAKAGLKRGDIIWTLNGQSITMNNYSDLFYASSVTLQVQHGLESKELETVSMEANNDWEDPVLLDTTYSVGDKKVGYLVYNSFDIKTMETLPEVFRKFKKEGIEELILDLRYNGGGFVKTECELASMIAPFANVVNNDVYQTEVHNEILTEAWKNQMDFNTYFSTSFEYKDANGKYDINEDISDANVDLKKLYVIVTGGSASASEGLIVGLGPYMDITLIGGKTYGKYCSGYMLSPKDVYGSSSQFDYSKIGNWGIYVMISKFADKDGNNSAIPDGIPVDIEVKDDVLDGFQFGDENETMLKAALKAAGKADTRGMVGHSNPFGAEFVSHIAPKGILINELPDLPNFPIQ